MTVDELRAYGVDHMDGGEIDAFLSTHHTGVLGLPGPEAPYLVPLSYGYDGDSRLYFFYVVGEESTKDELSAQAETARFLVYTAETAFNWRSVLLRGTMREVSDEQWDAVEDEIDLPWRPDLIETASAAEATRLYRFEVEERSGIKHVGLPPGFEERPKGDGEDGDAA
jgi:hypothetical protein